MEWKYRLERLNSPYFPYWRYDRYDPVCVIIKCCVVSFSFTVCNKCQCCDIADCIAVFRVGSGCVF